MLSNLLRFNNTIQNCSVVEFDTSRIMDLRQELINSNIIFYTIENKLYFLNSSLPDSLISRTDTINIGKVETKQFDTLNIIGRVRIIYVLIHNYLRHRGFFYVNEKNRAVYLPKYENEVRKNKGLFSERNGIVIHEGFDYQLLIISDGYYLAIKPKRYFTTDGFISVSCEQREVLANTILRENTRYCGENKKWLDFWINYLKGDNKNEIVFDYPNAPFVLRLSDSLYRIS